MSSTKNKVLFMLHPVGAWNYFDVNEVFSTACDCRLDITLVSVSKSYILTSTKSVICQIDANFSPFQSVNMLSVHITLERLKLIFYGLMSFFSKYDFKTGTLCLHFLSLEFDRNYFYILLWKNSKALWP